MNIYIQRKSKNGRILNYTYPTENNTEEQPQTGTPAIVPETEIQRLIELDGKYHKVINGIVTYDDTLPKWHGVPLLENLIFKLKQEMTNQDYKQFKYLRGELSNEEWEETKLWFSEKRKELESLEQEKKELEEVYL